MVGFRPRDVNLPLCGYTCRASYMWLDSTKLSLSCKHADNLQEYADARFSSASHDGHR